MEAYVLKYNTKIEISCFIVFEHLVENNISIMKSLVRRDFLRIRTNIVRVLNLLKDNIILIIYLIENPIKFGQLSGWPFGEQVALA